MTNDMMNRRALMEKSADADAISREMVGHGAHRLMERKVGSLTGGGARREERQADKPNWLRPHPDGARQLIIHRDRRHGGGRRRAF